MICEPSQSSSHPIIIIPHNPSNHRIPPSEAIMSMTITVKCSASQLSQLFLNLNLDVYMIFYFHFLFIDLEMEGYCVIGLYLLVFFLIIVFLVKFGIVFGVQQVYSEVYVCDSRLYLLSQNQSQISNRMQGKMFYSVWIQRHQHYGGPLFVSIIHFLKLLYIYISVVCICNISIGFKIQHQKELIHYISFHCIALCPPMIAGTSPPDKINSMKQALLAIQSTQRGTFYLEQYNKIAPISQFLRKIQTTLSSINQNIPIEYKQWELGELSDVVNFYDYVSGIVKSYNMQYGDKSKKKFWERASEIIFQATKRVKSEVQNNAKLQASLKDKNKIQQQLKQKIQTLQKQIAAFSNSYQPLKPQQLEAIRNIQANIAQGKVKIISNSYYFITKDKSYINIDAYLKKFNLTEQLVKPMLEQYSTLNDLELKMTGYISKKPAKDPQVSLSESCLKKWTKIQQMLDQYIPNALIYAQRMLIKGVQIASHNYTYEDKFPLAKTKSILVPFVEECKTGKKALEKLRTMIQIQPNLVETLDKSLAQRCFIAATQIHDQIIEMGDKLNNLISPNGNHKNLKVNTLTELFIRFEYYFQIIKINNRPAETNSNVTKQFAEKKFSQSGRNISDMNKNPLRDSKIEQQREEQQKQEQIEHKLTVKLLDGIEKAGTLPWWQFKQKYDISEKQLNERTNNKVLTADVVIWKVLESTRKSLQLRQCSICQVLGHTKEQIDLAKELADTAVELSKQVTELEQQLAKYKGAQKTQQIPQQVATNNHNHNINRVPTNQPGVNYLTPNYNNNNRNNNSNSNSRGQRMMETPQPERKTGLNTNYNYNQSQSLQSQQLRKCRLRIQQLEWNCSQYLLQFNEQKQLSQVHKKAKVKLEEQFNRIQDQLAQLKNSISSSQAQEYDVKLAEKDKKIQEQQKTIQNYNSVVYQVSQKSGDKNAEIERLKSSIFQLTTQINIKQEELQKLRGDINQCKTKAFKFLFNQEREFNSLAQMRQEMQKIIVYECNEKKNAQKQQQRINSLYNQILLQIDRQKAQTQKFLVEMRKFFEDQSITSPTDVLNKIQALKKNKDQAQMNLNISMQHELDFNIKIMTKLREISKASELELQQQEKERKMENKQLEEKILLKLDKMIENRKNRVVRIRDGSRMFSKIEDEMFVTHELQKYMKNDGKISGYQLLHRSSQQPTIPDIVLQKRANILVLIRTKQKNTIACYTSRSFCGTRDYLSPKGVIISVFQRQSYPLRNNMSPLELNQQYLVIGNGTIKVNKKLGSDNAIYVQFNERSAFDNKVLGLRHTAQNISVESRSKVEIQGLEIYQLQFQGQTKQIVDIKPVISTTSTDNKSPVKTASRVGQMQQPKKSDRPTTHDEPGPRNLSARKQEQMYRDLVEKAEKYKASIDTLKKENAELRKKLEDAGISDDNNARKKVQPQQQQIKQKVKQDPKIQAAETLQKIIRTIQKRQADRIEELLRDGKDAIKKIKDRQAKINKQIQEKQIKLEWLDTYIENRNVEMAIIDLEYAQMSDKVKHINEIKQEISKLKKNRQQLKQQIKKERQEYENTKKTEKEIMLKDIQKQKQSLIRLRQQSAKSLQNEKQQLAQIKTQLAKNKEELQKSKGVMTNAISKRQEVQKEYNAKNKLFKEITEKQKQITDRIKSKQVELSKQKQEIDKQLAQIERKKKQLKEIEENITKRKKYLDQIQEEYTQKQKKFQVLNTKYRNINQLKNQYDEIDKKLKKAADQYENKSQQIQAFATTINQYIAKQLEEKRKAQKAHALAKNAQQQTNKYIKAREKAKISLIQALMQLSKVKNQSLKYTSTQIVRENTTIKLSTDQLLFDENDKHFLMAQLRHLHPHLIPTSATLLYKFPLMAKIDPHPYIDNQMDFLVIILLQKGSVIALYSNPSLQEDKISKNGKGFVASVTNRKAFFTREQYNGCNVAIYCSNEMIFGNGEFKFHCKVAAPCLRVSLGGDNRSYETRDETEELFMGSKVKKQEILAYEIYQVLFEKEDKIRKMEETM